MKTKTVTIHNWDGSEYDIEAPVKAKYLGIMSHTGVFCFYSGKPKLDADGYYCNSQYYLDDPGGISISCPHDANLPYHDGYGISGTVIKNGIHVAELLLKIEEV